MLEAARRSGEAGARAADQRWLAHGRARGRARRRGARRGRGDRAVDDARRDEVGDGARRRDPRTPRAPSPVANHDTSYEIEIVEDPLSALPVLRERGAWTELAQAIRDAVREGVEHGTPDEDEQLELLLELGKIEAESARPARSRDRGVAERAHDRRGRCARARGDARSCSRTQQRWADSSRCSTSRSRSRRTRSDAWRCCSSSRRSRTSGSTTTRRRSRRTSESSTGIRRTRSRRASSRRCTSAREQWEPLAALLLDRASRHKDPPQRIAALEAVARMYEDKVGDPRAAFLVWLTIFRIAPDRLQHHRRARTARAARAMRGTSCSPRAPRSPRSSRSGARSRRRAVWQLVGVWTRDHVGNRDDAMRALERAVALDPPRTRRSTSSSRCCAPTRDGSTSRRCSRGARSSRPIAASAASSYAQLGELYETALADAGEAIRWYEAALADEPEAKHVLIALHRLYLATEAWDALPDLVPRLIGVLDAAAERPIVLDLLRRARRRARRSARPSRRCDARVRGRARARSEARGGARGPLARLRADRRDRRAARSARGRGRCGAERERYAEVATAWSRSRPLRSRGRCWRKLLATRAAGSSGACGPRAGAARRRGVERARRAAARLARARGADRARRGPRRRSSTIAAGAIAAYRAVLAIDPNASRRARGTRAALRSRGPDAARDRGAASACSRPRRPRSRAPSCSSGSVSSSSTCAIPRTRGSRSRRRSRSISRTPARTRAWRACTSCRASWSPRARS